LQGEVARGAERVKYPADRAKQAGSVAAIPVH
jgi:hypothetical protein